MAIGTVTVEQLRERVAAAQMALIPELVGRMQLDASALLTSTQVSTSLTKTPRWPELPPVACVM